MRLPEFSIRRPVAITMLFMAIVVLGIISLNRLGIDFFPDIEYPVISIVTTYEGVAPEDIELLVSKPIEETVSLIKGVKEVESTSYEGISVVMVEFEWGTNLDFAAQDIRAWVDSIADLLPEDIDNPLVLKFDVAMMPIVVYGITGDRDLVELRSLVDDRIKPRLEQTDGVASAIVFGGKEREFLVEIDRDRLEAYGLSLPQVAQVLHEENINLRGGHIIEGPREFLVRTLGEFEEIGQIEETVITVRDGVPIYLRDIAQVFDTYKEIRDYTRTNMRDSVTILISRESGANTVGVVAKVREEMGRLEKDLPEDIRIYKIWDQAEFIEGAISRVASAAGWGGLVAIFVLFLFLRSYRPVAAIILAIPLAFIATFIPMHFIGYTLNMMTLGGLALALGMLVDNAIIVTENIFRHLQEGKSRIEAAKVGASEVGRAITASTLTTVVVFLPLAYTVGVAGRMARGLGLTVVFSLVASLFVALTLVPMVASKIFEKKPVTSNQLPVTDKWFYRLRIKYKEFLGWTLQHRARVILAALGIFILSLALIPLLGREFIPSFDSGLYMLYARMPVGTSLEETDRVVRRIEKVAMGQEEVEVTGSWVGLYEGSKMDLAFGWGAAGVNEAQVMGTLVARELRDRSIHEVVDTIRRRVPTTEGLETHFMKFGPETLTGGGRATATKVDIRVFGKDLATLEEISNMVAAKIKDIEGLCDVDVAFRKGKPELQIRVDRERASQMGLGVGQVARIIQVAIQGQVVTRIREAGDEIDLRLRFREEDRKDLADLTNVTILSPQGRAVRLDEVAKVWPGRGPESISRKGRQRLVSVTADVVAGRDLGSVMEEVKNRVSSLPIEPGYSIEYGGEYKEMVEMFVSFCFVLAVAILLVYMVMAAQFENLIHPFVVMFSLPLALVGIVLALLITGKTLSLPSFIGIVMVCGIAVNDAIVLVDYVNQLRARGLSRDEALIQGGVVRFRPIILTTATTIFAMVPMTLGRGLGIEMRAPMAIAIIGGLLASTLLTLIVVPTLYSVLDGLAARIKVRVQKGGL